MIRIAFVVALAGLCVGSVSAVGQHINKWNKEDLTYVTREKIDKNSTGDRKLYDADNEFVGINIESVSYQEESPDFLKDLKYGCKEICGDMKLKFEKDGEKFLTGLESYYVICHGNEPVITAIILREEIKKVYEISIYCYKIEMDEGIEILKSMKFDAD